MTPTGGITPTAPRPCLPFALLLVVAINKKRKLGDEEPRKDCIVTKKELALSCVKCSATFRVSYAEKKFFQRQRFGGCPGKFPKRCASCRRGGSTATQRAKTAAKKAHGDAEGRAVAESRLIEICWHARSQITAEDLVATLLECFPDIEARTSSTAGGSKSGNGDAG